MIYKAIHRKLTNKKHEFNKNTSVNSCAPLVVPFVLQLNDTSIM